MNTKIQLLNALIGLRKELQRFQRGMEVQYFKNDLGICDNLTRHLSLTDEDACMDLLDTLFKQWPEFSGSEFYPVPHPTMRPNAAFTEADIQQNMWDSDQPYGAARIRLLDWLITRLEAEIEAETKAENTPELGMKGEAK